jgi:prefoldin subunit 5
VNTSDWIQLVTAIVTILGGGAVVVAKLTRIAVAAEVLAKRIEEIGGSLTTTNQQVQNHENRLNKGGL